MGYLLSLLVFIAVLSGFLLLVAKFSKKKDRKLLIDATYHEEQVNQNIVPEETAKIELAVEPKCLPVEKIAPKKRVPAKKKTSKVIEFAPVPVTKKKRAKKPSSQVQ